MESGSFLENWSIHWCFSFLWFLVLSRAERSGNFSINCYDIENSSMEKKKPDNGFANNYAESRVVNSFQQWKPCDILNARNTMSNYLAQTKSAKQQFCAKNGIHNWFSDEFFMIERNKSSWIHITKTAKTWKLVAVVSCRCWRWNVNATSAFSYKLNTNG